MKPQDDQEPLIPPDASISNPARAQSRLRGSHSSQQPLIPRRRPPGDGDDGPPDGDGEPPPPPPPPVSVPDVAMQFSPCLPDAVRADVVRAIRDATGGTADVRALCQNQSERIGLWFRPVVNPDDNAARDRGLQRLNLLQVRLLHQFEPDLPDGFRCLEPTAKAAQWRRQPGSERTDPSDELLGGFRKSQPRRDEDRRLR